MKNCSRTYCSDVAHCMTPRNCGLFVSQPLFRVVPAAVTGFDLISPDTDLPCGFFLDKLSADTCAAVLNANRARDAIFARENLPPPRLLNPEIE